MRAGLFPVALAALCLFVACAYGQVVSTFVQGASGPAYVGPGDATAYNPGAVLGYYGAPCYSGAKAAAGQNMFDLNNGLTTNTYACNAGGGWDEAGANTFCGGSGNCYVTKIYNQSGGSWPDCTQVNPTHMVVYFNVQNGHAMIQSNSGYFTCTLGAAPTLPFTVAHTLMPTSVSAQLFVTGGGGHTQIEIGESGSTFSIYNGTRLPGGAVAINTFYTNYVIFGTTISGSTDSTVAVNNGTPATGSAGTSAPTTNFTLGGTTYTGYFGNFLFDNERMNSTQLTGGYNNQKAGGVYW